MGLATNWRRRLVESLGIPHQILAPSADVSAFDQEARRRCPLLLEVIAVIPPAPFPLPLGPDSFPFSTAAFVWIPVARITTIACCLVVLALLRSSWVRERAIAVCVAVFSVAGVVGGWCLASVAYPSVLTSMVVIPFPFIILSCPLP